MLIFLDTEFTNLPSSKANDGYLPKPKLISLGLVTETGDHFYVESSDFEARFCSDFVRQTVLPLLLGYPRLSPAALRVAINRFLSAQPENSRIACDYSFDYELLVRAAGGELPPNIQGDYINLAGLEDDPGAIAATERYFSAGRARHHALNDAEALRLAYQGVSGDFGGDKS